MECRERNLPFHNSPALRCYRAELQPLPQLVPKWCHGSSEETKMGTVHLALSKPGAELRVLRRRMRFWEVAQTMPEANAALCLVLGHVCEVPVLLAKPTVTHGRHPLCSVHLQATVRELIRETARERGLCAQDCMLLNTAAPCYHLPAAKVCRNGGSRQGVVH